MIVEQKGTEAAPAKVSPRIFALGEMGLGLVGNSIGIYALFLYTDKLGLPLRVERAGSAHQYGLGRLERPAFWLLFSFLLYILI